MGLMDGKEIAQHLKQHEGTKHIPIVILTASSQTQEKDKLEKTCQGFLSTRISCIQLLQELKKHLHAVSNFGTSKQLDRLSTDSEEPELLHISINYP
jgi:CheY-like chemotaxis protein